MKILSYNIRYDNPRDSSPWKVRKEKVAALLHTYAPSLIATQEGLKHQIDDLDQRLEHYSYLGQGRGDGQDKGEYCAIFYDHRKMEVLESQTFWLSEQPNSPSRSWDAALPRICTYAQFKLLEQEQKFWLLNTHYDHRGRQAQIESSKLLLKKIQEFQKIGDLPLILTGDFNQVPHQTAIKILSSQLSDAYTITQQKPFGPVGTYNGFSSNTWNQIRIDYFFLSPQKFRVHSYHCIDDKIGGTYPSDHFPILIDIDFQNN